MKVAFLGDIVGRPGRNFVMEKIHELRVQHSLDFIVVNAETQLVEPESIPALPQLCTTLS